MNLCEHGNYHCQICEVRMLNMVCQEQNKTIKQLHEENIKLKEHLYNDYKGMVNNPLSFDDWTDMYFPLR